MGSDCISSWALLIFLLWNFIYRKNLKNSDIQTVAVIILKLEQNQFTTDELGQNM